MKTLKPVALLVSLLLIFRTAHLLAAESGQLAYIGTYTGAQSKGIYMARFDPATGALGTPQLAAQTRNPTFLALDPHGRFLYAANEVNDFGGQDQGAISAFKIDPKTGVLTSLNQQPSGGSGPCHLAITKHENGVLVANYGSGSVAALSFMSDGRLEPPIAQIQHHGSSVNPRRQAGPHAHFITPDPIGRYALACDLGLDQVLVYRLDPSLGWLTPNDPPAASLPPGSGPRHLAFSRNGRFVYVLNEMGSSFAVFRYRANRGALEPVQTVSTLPEDFKGQNTSAEVQLHPSGRFIYASNRGHDSIAVFAIDETTGKLSPLGHQSTQGRTPRHFTFDRTGRWLLAENQDTDNIVVFAVDGTTGRLLPTGKSISVVAPVCLVFSGPP